MRYYAVTQEHGAGWDAARSRREQDKWDEHAAFMDALVDEGFVVLGGPLGDGANVMVIFNASSEDEIHARLADDPWTPMEVLRTTKVEPWEIWLDGR